MSRGEIKGWIQSINLHPKLYFVLVTWWDATIIINFKDEFLPAINDILSRPVGRYVRVTADNDDVDDLGTAHFHLHSIEMIEIDQ